MLWTPIQSKNLSNISQYFAISALSDYPSSLKAKSTDVLKICTARRIIKCWKLCEIYMSGCTLGHNCNPSSKSINIKS